MITPASDEATISDAKPESPISDEVVDSIKEIETKFAKSGIVMNDDEISVDIATTTGLRKTGFSEVLYEDNPLLAAKKAVQSRIPKSPMLTRRKSMDNCSTINDDESTLRRIPAYRSVRKPQQQKERTPLKENTWNGRSSVSPTNQAKKRPTITSDTFKSPSRTASLTRNTPARSSQQFDARTRQRSSTRTSSSVNTSPNKTANNTAQSPLAQQLLEAAGKARNDAQILGKIKQILNDYASKNKVNGDFDDFTATWVNNNGNLDNKNDDNESPVKSLSKRSSSISTSSDSNPTTSSREAAAAVISPRRSDKGMSRIPAPVRSNTGLY
jgi:growth arrest-specific protein 2